MGDRLAHTAVSELSFGYAEYSYAAQPSIGVYV
jgi:hypothetical protein